MDDQIMTERQFMEALGIQRKDVEAMRRAGLPFIRAGRSRRLYLLSATLDWAKANLVSASAKKEE